MKRREILDSAIQCVCNDRQDTHGNPEDTLTVISDLWDMYLGHKYNIDISIKPEDVAWMMVLLKTARAISNPTHVDNFVDAAGYAALAGEVAQ